MTSSPDTPASTMSRQEIDDLIQTLRNANAHYSQLAAASRAFPRPLKARKQARSLNLSVCVEAASRLDQKQISVVPLPLLDLVPSPSSASPTTNDTAIPEIVVPIPRYPSQTGQLGIEITRPARPVLGRVIPSRIIFSVQEDVASCSPDQYILGSVWSASTTGSGETDEKDDEEDNLDLEIPQPAQVGVRYPGSDDNENLDILVSPDDDRHPQFPLPVRTQVKSPEFQLQNTQSAEVPALAHFSSSSESSQSSLELVTPISSDERPELIPRMKRKSFIDDVDTDDEDHYMVAEKRPKYERNLISISANERRGHRRTDSSSRRPGNV